MGTYLFVRTSHRMRIYTTLDCLDMIINEYGDHKFLICCDANAEDGNHKIVRVLHQSSKGCEEYRTRVKDEIKRWSMEVPESLRCEDIDQEMAKLSGIITEAK
ncbi:hypothetical protein FOZ63_008225, partial [Perkinsus olseni]